MTAISSLAACAHTGKPQTDSELRGMGMVLESQLAPGARPKDAVLARTDAGNRVFAHGRLLASSGNSISSIGGGTNMSFPRWVRVTWREGSNIQYEDGRFVGGTVVGDYKVEVLSRIPDEVFRYANSAPGRGIRLSFRIKDDGVLLAWDVQETVVHHPTGARGFVYSMHGGDFPCETSPYQSHPDCTNGPLKEAPWYTTAWER
ncbi:hypothetical protein ACFOLJ_27930 [Rugamonas sp. CCM 8940]|uniref:hypothetical protein n=1 Tax=Rugamonas sp. CCM 8940 TaxID=2765359 RepID=UPI0018F33C48|nr:hypothetical protein [Rugamonas sp. CCM 8940]MBJ7312023.1 hypothetical protein [Rugamonas sp. CCM 8940]